MSQNNKDLLQEAFKLVRSILPYGKVYIFGSRATGDYRLQSDLDLAIDIGKNLTISEMTELKTSFEFSLFPVRVDIVDLNSVSEEFKEKIFETAKELN